MMKIEKFICNNWQENTYLLYDETREAVIVDCGADNDRDFERIAFFVETMHLNVVAALSTHLHLDHVFGCGRVKRAWGIGFKANAADNFFIERWNEVCAMFGVDESRVERPDMPEEYLEEGDEVRFGRSVLKVLETPGHSPGSLSFYSENDALLLTGDLLFAGGVGRSDLPGGSGSELYHSLKKVTGLPEQVTVYPGHGPKTTVGMEKNNNPYI